MGGGRLGFLQLGRLVSLPGTKALARNFTSLLVGRSIRAWEKFPWKTWNQTRGPDTMKYGWGLGLHG